MGELTDRCRYRYCSSEPRLSLAQMGAAIFTLAVAALFVLIDDAGATRTTGTSSLDEVRAAASENARCGLSTDQLAAIMLAPTFPETGAPWNRAPSPMTLSRYDNQSALYSFGNPATYTEAFWHPGVGQWQFDEAGGWGMTAAERIDLRTSARKAAQVMADRWCAKQTLSYVWAPWFGCGTSTCQNIYNDIFDGKNLRNVALEEVGVLGGVEQRLCSLANRAGYFNCWYVDPGRAQGYQGFTSPTFGPAPVTAPFYSYELDGEEVRHWAQVDTGYSISITAHLPQGKNSRTSLTWETESQLCDISASRGICDPIPLLGIPLRLFTINGAYAPFPGDFDGDGKDDIFWYGPGSGADALWFGDASRNFEPQPSVVNGSFKPLVGDFDGDGKDDVFWYAPGANPDFVWYGSGARTFTGFSRPVNGVFLPLVGDFDGDGKDDVFWYAPGANPDFVWYGSGARTFTSSSRPVNGAFLPLVGDFDGDGKDDIFWYAPSTNPDWVWYHQSRAGWAVVSENIGGGYRPMVGDFDGKREDEIFMFHSGSGPSVILDHIGEVPFRRITRSVSGDFTTVAADSDSDRVDDLVLYAPGTAADFLYHGSGHRTAFKSRVEIRGDYFPIVGQFDGDGGEDIFWYRPGADYDAVWFGADGVGK